MNQIIKKVTFKKYFNNWWIWGPYPSIPTLCPYLTRRYYRMKKPSYANSRITLNKYQKHIEPYFASMKLAEIKAKHIESWRDVLSRYGLSGKTQGYLLSNLRVMLREAKRLGDIDHNPVLEVLPPTKNKPRKRGILSICECNQFITSSVSNLTVHL